MSKSILEFLALLEFEEVSSWNLHVENELPQLVVSAYCWICFISTLINQHSNTDLLYAAVQTLITKARHRAQKLFM